MQLSFLAEQPQFIPVLTNWYFNEWGYEVEGNTLEKEQQKIATFCNTEKLPLSIVAHENGEVLGSIGVKEYEMDIFPDRVYWLGGVYVVEQHRGKGIAEKLIDAIKHQAVQLNITRLYLQTEHLSGGLYKKLGWAALEQITYEGREVLIMEFKL